MADRGLGRGLFLLPLVFSLATAGEIPDWCVTAACKAEFQREAGVNGGSTSGGVGADGSQGGSTEAGALGGTSKPYALTTTDKVFFIGANKAGTTSLQGYFDALPGKWVACHNECDHAGHDVTYKNALVPTESQNRHSWSYVSKKQLGNSAVWEGHRAYMDNGDVADFAWLYKTFPNSRFVMNVRALRAWVLSRFDMVKQIRLGGNCTAIGDSGSGTDHPCKAGVQNTSDYPTPFPSPWTGNSPQHIRSWITSLSDVQQQQLAFFNESVEKMNRFIMLDVPGSDEKETLARLGWIMRDDLNSMSTRELMRLGGAFPYMSVTASMPPPHSMPHEFTSKHSRSAAEFVDNVLFEAGCMPFSADILYRDCAESIRSSGLRIFDASTQSLES